MFSLLHACLADFSLAVSIAHHLIHIVPLDSPITPVG